MFCSLSSTTQLAVEDVRAIGQHLAHDEQHQMDVDRDLDSAGSSKKPRDSDTLLTEPDANPLTDDESDSEAQQQPSWPAWESTSEAESAKLDDPSANEWLRNCLISVSPSMEFVVMAEVQAFVILERSVKNDKQMEVAASVRIEVSNLSDYITAILILPLASTRRTEASQIDFTCIVVALSSGHVNFYTERGVLIFRERVADSPITVLRFGQSFFAGNQELVALASNCLHVMEGLSLFSVLKTARMEIARGERSLTEISEDHAINAHCLQLGSLRKAYDFQLLGIQRPPLFDQLACSTQNGHTLKNLASTSSHIFCSTSMSFASFLLFDSEATNRNVLSDTIHHYSSKITAAVPSIGFRSFFGLGQSRKDRPQKAEVADARRIRINIQSRLVDPIRHCERSFFAFGSWMAICDENARVLLIDTKSRSVIRIWKGYRNARCAFIESSEQMDDKRIRRKRVLFLAIFAPKRGILEVWSLRFGPRVAAFNVDPKGRLLTIPHPKEGILLGQSTTANVQGQTAPTVVFLTPDGNFKTISIPFHFAALANANRLHDENLLKESNLNELIHFDSNKQLHFNAFQHALQSLKTLDSQKRLLERIISLSTIGKLKALDVDQVLEACVEGSKADLKAHLGGLRRITQIYIRLSEKEDEKMDSTNNDEEKSKDCEYDRLRDTLLMSVEEYEELNLALLVESKLPSPSAHSMYLGEFRDQLAFADLECRKIAIAQQCDHLRLALHVFKPFFHNSNIEERFDRTLDQLEIPKTDLLDLFLLAWQNEWNTHSWTIVGNALKLLQLILGHFKDSETASAIETIEQSIYQSENPRSSLFLLLAHRAIERRQQGLQHADFEVLDDRTAWLLMSARHLSIMSLIGELNPNALLGLARAADKSYGFYREQIGQFIALTQMDADHLMNLLKSCRQHPFLTDDKDNTPTESAPLSYQDLILSAIFRQFPYSFAIELLFCDCAWECASRWFRSDQQPPNRSIQHLESSISYLSHVNVVSRLQHGLSLMIWDTFVRTPFESLYKSVITNEGRFPRDRVLRKDVYVTEMELPRFMRCVRNLLKILQMAVVDLEIQPKVEHKYEDFVENFFENRRIKVKKSRHHTLTEVSVVQHSVNYHLVLHHIHLAICLELQLLLNLRRPLQHIFPDIALRAFFADLHEHPLIPISDVDEQMLQRRQDFMEEVVSAVGVQQSDDPQYHDQWELINELTKDWALDADLLRIKEIQMLHEGNFDADAEKLYAAVQNRNLLAIRLTPVAMGRFKALVDSQEGLKVKAPKKLKQTTWNAIRSLPDQFMPNFEPKHQETLALIKSVLYMFAFSTKPSKEHYQQMNASNEKKLLSELCEFIDSNPGGQ